MRRVIWTNEARNDLVAIQGYITDFNPVAAQRLGERMFALADRLSAASERGRVVAPGIRQMAVLSPYLLRYRVTEEAVYIVNIRHGARSED